jgi:hypothetical protein
MFYELMLESGTSKWNAWILYQSVKIWGKGERSIEFVNKVNSLYNGKTKEDYIKEYYDYTSN